MNGHGLLSVCDLTANPWAACGQAALSAVLGRPLEKIMPVCPDRRWMNARDMRYALARLEAKVSDTPYVSADQTNLERRWPCRGLVLVQFVGTWAGAGRSTVDLKRTHWIGVSTPAGAHREPMVFDVNVLQENVNHGWSPRSYWEARVVPGLVKSHRKATGAWWIREGLEVTP